MWLDPQATAQHTFLLNCNQSVEKLKLIQLETMRHTLLIPMEAGNHCSRHYCYNDPHRLLSPIPSSSPVPHFNTGGPLLGLGTFQ